MQSQEKNKIIIIRLFPGEEVIEQLKRACKKHKLTAGVVVSGLGQLKRVSLGYFRKKGDYTPETFEKPQELLSLTGTITKQEKGYNLHLHTTLGDENKKVVGGHLISGIVTVTAEIAIIKTDIKIKRILEEETGLYGMFLE